MKTRLFDHFNIDPSRCHLPDGSGKDLEKACRQYDEQIRALGGNALPLALGRDFASRRLAAA